MDRLACVSVSAEGVGGEDKVEVLREMKRYGERMGEGRELWGEGGEGKGDL